MLSIYIKTAFVLCIFFTIAFIVGQMKQNNGLQDVFWGLGFVLAANYSYFTAGHDTMNGLIVTVLVTI